MQYLFKKDIYLNLKNECWFGIFILKTLLFCFTIIIFISSNNIKNKLFLCYNERIF